MLHIGDKVFLNTNGVKHPFIVKGVIPPDQFMIEAEDVNSPLFDVGIVSWDMLYVTETLKYTPDVNFETNQG